MGGVGCEANLDDIVIYSAIWEEHISQLKQVSQRLGDATINLAKCDFAKATVTYLGKVVGDGMIKNNATKIWGELGGFGGNME